LDRFSYLNFLTKEALVGIFFNYLVGKISKECKIPESEISSTLSWGDRYAPKVDMVSISIAIKNYKMAFNWRQKQKAIWQIYYHYKANGLGL